MGFQVNLSLTQSQKEALERLAEKCESDLDSIVTVIMRAYLNNDTFTSYNDLMGTAGDNNG